MIGLKSIVFLAGVTGTAAIRMECDSFTTEAIRIFSWRNSGVWRSILLGLKRSNTIWKADNEIYLLTISDLGFRIEFLLFGEILLYRHFSKPDFKSVCGYILTRIVIFKF